VLFCRCSAKYFNVDFFFLYLLSIAFARDLLMGLVLAPDVPNVAPSGIGERLFT